VACKHRTEAELEEGGAGELRCLELRCVWRSCKKSDCACEDKDVLLTTSFKLVCTCLTYILLHEESRR
jgi:hypothetical protein